jgi:dTDP-4-dehydrorhamnose reductase
MLGRAWCQLLDREGFTYTAHDIDTLDLTKADNLARLVEIQPAWVINCAAYTDVDGAETDSRAAFDVNTGVPAALATLCRQNEFTLIHYSTDYVFGGQAKSSRRVGDRKVPMGVYGRSKLLGEEAIADSGCRHLIVRTSWLYAPWGKNFVRTIAAAARKRDKLRVVDDQRGRPTSAEHLAAVTLELIRRDQLGTFHVTDGGDCTWCDFAGQIVRLTGADCTVEPCTSEEYPRPAERPAYSVLDLTATEELVGAMPRWQDNLADVLGRMEPADQPA